MNTVINNYGAMILYPESEGISCGTPCIFGNSTDNKIFYSNYYDPYNGLWPKLEEIPAAYNVEHKPVAALFRKRLYVFWTNPQGYVYFSYYNNSTWSRPVQYSKWWSDSSPSLAVFKDKLYAVWNGYYHDAFYWSETSNGNEWSPHAPISLGRSVPKSTRSVSTAIYKDKMYMMWCTNNKLQYGWFDGNTWSDVHVFEQSDMIYKYLKCYMLFKDDNLGAPTLIVLNEKLYVIYNSFSYTSDVNKRVMVGYSSVYSIEDNSWSDPKFVDLINYKKNPDYLKKNIFSPSVFRNSICVPLILSNGKFFHKVYKSHQGQLYDEPINYYSENIKPILNKTIKFYEFDAVFALTEGVINHHLEKLFTQQWNIPIREASLPWKLDTVDDVSPLTPSVQDSHTVKSQGRDFLCPQLEIINSTSRLNPESEVLLKTNLFDGIFYPDGINERSTAINIENWSFKIKSKLGIRKLDRNLEHEVYPEFKDKLNNMRESYGDIDILFLDLQSAQLFGDINDISFGKSIIDDKNKRKFAKAIQDYVKSIRSHPHGNPHGWIFSGVAANREVHRTVPDKGEIHFTSSAFAVHASKDEKAVYWLLMANDNPMPNVVETGIADHYLIDSKSNGTFHIAQSAVLGAVMSHIHGSYGIVMFDINETAFIAGRITRREFSAEIITTRSITFSYRQDKILCNITDYVESDGDDKYSVLFPAERIAIESEFEYDIDINKDKIYFEGCSVFSKTLIRVSGHEYTEKDFDYKYPTSSIQRLEARKQLISDIKAKLESENKTLLGGVNHSFLQIAQPAHTKYDFARSELSELFGLKVILSPRL